MDKIGLVIVEDHALLRETWGFILNNHPGFKVLAEFGRGEEAVEFCRLYKPDLVMMDINLPGIVNGLEATAMIRKYSPATKVIAVSLHNQPVFARKMVEAGAKGYITKNSSKEEMIQGLLEVSKGGCYICAEIKENLSAEMLNGKKEMGLEVLSNREKEIVGMLKIGASSREIANELYITTKTVEVHRYNILRKLSLKNTAALINYINKHSI
jgi:DNA-binding NarL/FixJ family response regulator